jgi:2-keto-4-pentenoate hydratase
MLSTSQVDQAAQMLVAARRSNTPGPRLPEACRPADTDDALAIQARVLELLNESIGGWKCGVPAPHGGAIVAPIPASAILHSLPCAVPGNQGLIEPEVAFVVGHDLPARATLYTDEEIRGAIAEERLVLELITSRYADKRSVTAPEILADAFNNHALLVGPEAPGALDQPLEQLHIVIRTPTETLFDKVHGHPSGHPMKAFTWLVHFLNSRGEGLKAGQIVTTGSYAGIVEAPVETPIHVQLGGLGSFDAALVTGKP